MEDRPLHGRLLGLVSATSVVLVLFRLGPGMSGLAEHLHDGSISSAGLQSE
ncbi:hypothetical protein ACGFWI_38025 [Streptomyces sp. NPDC048434]|uniref:hypothetical protein n=1 Tax=Streptomyces sp. NPDC048434 TaxID=3365549 RepID=UPI0037244BD5